VSAPSSFLDNIVLILHMRHISLEMALNWIARNASHPHSPLAGPTV
jgi:hypothetical protein